MQRQAAQQPIVTNVLAGLLINFKMKNLLVQLDQIVN